MEDESDILKNNASGVRFVFKHLLASIFLAALGIIIIVLLDTTFRALKEHTYYIIFEHIATALIIAGIWHAINHLFIWKEFICIISRLINLINSDKIEIIRAINTARRDTELGLTDAYNDVGDFNFNEFILHPKELTIVLGQGFGWVPHHIDALRLRISDPQKMTKFFFIHPDSKAAELIAKKIQLEKEDYCRKAQATIQILKQEMKKDSNLLIYGHFSVPHHSVYFADKNSLVITPYFFSHSRRNPPVFVFNKGAFVTKVKLDLETLETESTIL